MRRPWKIGNARSKTKPHMVRWVVAGEVFTETFVSFALADAFRSELIQAMNKAEEFDVATGLPISKREKIEAEQEAEAQLSWLQFRVDYVAARWPEVAAKTRDAIADSLATVTRSWWHPDQTNPMPVSPTSHPVGCNPSQCRRRATQGDSRRPRLSKCALLPAAQGTRRRDLSPQSDPPTRSYAGGPVRSKRHLPPPSSRPECRPGVRGRVEASRREPAQAGQDQARRRRRPGRPARRRHPPPGPRAADVSVRVGSFSRGRGRRLVAFFAVLYYAGLRPAEATALRVTDCTLPEQGWGKLTLAETFPVTTKKWTDDGQRHDRRGLRQRDPNAVSPVPIPPWLVTILLTHIAEHGVAEDGRLFSNERGAIIGSTTYSRVWEEARQIVFTPAQAESPLAGRPYDLGHAALSTWLNAGLEVRRQLSRDPASPLRRLPGQPGRGRQPPNRELHGSSSRTRGRMS